MSDQLDQLKKLRVQIRSYKDTLKYYKKIFEADGKIDEKEQAELNKLDELITKIEENISARQKKLNFKAKISNTFSKSKEGISDALSKKDDIVDHNLVDAPAVAGAYIKPPWLTEAEKHIGKKKTARMVKDDPWVSELFKSLGAYDWAKDQTENTANWCAAFVSYCLKKTGQASLSGFDGMRALTYAESYGKEIKRPVYGAIAIVKRGGGGHIGFVVGYNKKSKVIKLLGGNQGGNSAVSIKNENRKLVAYKVPSNWTVPEQNYLD